MNTWVVYVHADGCGKAAFHYRAAQVILGRGLFAMFARNLDGTEIMDDDEVVCGSCLKALRTPLRWEQFQ